ncbi:MAG: hypothetical protein ABIA93_06525 [Candidatus Woesearchaeota archaeon]
MRFRTAFNRTAARVALGAALATAVIPSAALAAKQTKDCTTTIQVEAASRTFGGTWAEVYNYHRDGEEIKLEGEPVSRTFLDIWTNRTEGNLVYALDNSGGDPVPYSPRLEPGQLVKFTTPEGAFITVNKNSDLNALTKDFRITYPEADMLVQRAVYNGSVSEAITLLVQKDLGCSELSKYRLPFAPHLAGLEGTYHPILKPMKGAEKTQSLEGCLGGSQDSVSTGIATDTLTVGEGKTYSSSNQIVITPPKNGVVQVVQDGNTVTIYSGNDAKNRMQDGKKRKHDEERESCEESRVPHQERGTRGRHGRTPVSLDGLVQQDSRFYPGSPRTPLIVDLGLRYGRLSINNDGNTMVSNTASIPFMIGYQQPLWQVRADIVPTVVGDGVAYDAALGNGVDVDIRGTRFSVLGEGRLDWKNAVALGGALGFQYNNQVQEITGRSVYGDHFASQKLTADEFDIRADARIMAGTFTDNNAILGAGGTFRIQRYASERDDSQVYQWWVFNPFCAQTGFGINHYSQDLKDSRVSIDPQVYFKGKANMGNLSVEGGAYTQWLFSDGDLTGPASERLNRDSLDFHGRIHGAQLGINVLVAGPRDEGSLEVGVVGGHNWGNFTRDKILDDSIGTAHEKLKDTYGGLVFHWNP